jgi:hypothetical protein
MTIKVNYTKEKGLVQELDSSGEGGFFVDGNSILDSSSGITRIILANNNINDPNNENVQTFPEDTDHLLIKTDGTGARKYIKLPGDQNTLKDGKIIFVSLAEIQNQNDSVQLLTFNGAIGASVMSQNTRIKVCVYNKSDLQWKVLTTN